MIFRIFITFLLWEGAFGYPQAIRIPEIKFSAAPQEVNSLTEHRQYPRSIGKSPTTYNKIEETIKEVEAMLKINPTLPRLTRGEIMDLIENITKEDMENGKFGNETSGRDPKAIMLVMPYTPSNTNDKNMAELFTKPPVTQIVGAEPFQLKSSEDLSNINMDNFGLKSGNQISTAPKEDSFNHIPYSNQNIKSTSTQISIISTTTSTPVYTKPRTKQRRRRPPQPTLEQQKTTEPPVTTHRPRRPIRRRPTTTTKHPNHRYPDEELLLTEPKKVASLPSDGIKIIDGPKFDPAAEDLIMQENRQKTTFTNEEDSESLFKTSESAPQPTVVNALEKKTTDTPITKLDSQLKDSTLDKKSEAPEKKKPVATKQQTSPEDDELRKLLASLGVMPVSTTTTTTQIPDISNVADNLTPEMRDLLSSFGLMPNPAKQPTTQKPPVLDALEGFNPVKAEVKPDSYSGFKPLPEDDNNRQEMEELLARFGLGGARKRKSLPKKKEEGVSFDAVPEQYKGVLEDIGLMERNGRMIRAEPLVKTEEKQHVFSPGDSQYASDDEITKLNRLLDFVKKLEKLNRTVTDEDVQKMDVDNLKELLDGLNKEKKVPLDEQNAPNPINIEPSMDKNEVKRQKNSTASSNPKAEVENITLSITVKEETVTPNIKDLEASFGGQVDANPVTEPPVVETTQTPRTGFYYLMDWNTFLDIDDQKGKRVNLRFQPKVGDPKRFYSVSVP